MKIERKIDITISDISAEEIAAMFWAMDDYEQARFFNHLGAAVPELDERVKALEVLKKVNGGE